MELSHFLDRLSGVRKVGAGYMAICPSHPDQKASLHVTANDQGIGLKCHAGCGTDEILADLDLPWDALFNDEPKKRADPIEYDYKDSNGRLLYQVLRYENKEFRQRVPNGNTWTWSLNGVKRVPYMLPDIIESDSDTPIFVVEGEKDVHTLRARGILATTNSGGARWDWPEDWKVYFEGRKVILIPDTDEPGLEHMDQVGKLLSSVADVFTIRLQKVKDITDWFIAHPDPNLEEFNALVEAATPFGETSLKISEPPPEFEWPVAPVWDGLLGRINKLVDPHTESDPIALFMELMAMFGCAMNTAPHFNIKKSKQRGNLHLCIVGKTSDGRKGTAHDIAVDLFRQVNEEFITKRMTTSMATGEGLIHFIRDPTMGKDGQVIDPGSPDKRVLIVDAEFAATTLIQLQRTGNTLAGILRYAWDNPPSLSINTKHSSETTTDPHVSLIGHATPMELMQNLRASDIAAGSANRILWFMVRKSKTLDNPEMNLPEEQLRPLILEMQQALRFAWSVGEVKLSEKAHATWAKIRRDFDIDDDNGQLVHFLNRAMPQIGRMALILALLDQCRTIEPRHLEQAAGLFAYARKSVEYFLQSDGVYFSGEEAKLFNLLQDEEEGVSQREIQMKLGWSGKKTRAVSTALVKKGMAREYTEPAKGGRGGKPRRVLAI